MFNIFSFFKKSSKKEEKKLSNHETIESNLRKDEDKEAKIDDLVTLNKNLDESNTKKVDDLSVIERILDKKRKDSEDIIVESKIGEKFKRESSDGIDVPLVNSMSIKNDKANNELFVKALGEVDVKESIFKKYVNKQLNRDPHMIQTNISQDRSELSNRYDRLKDDGFIPDYADNFQNNNNEISSRKSIKMEKVASVLEQISKLDEVMLLEMVNANKNNQEIDYRIIRDVEDKKIELLQKIINK